MTHSYAIMFVSPATYQEIRQILNEAGYDDQFHQSPGHGEVIDMQGIAICEDPGKCEHCSAGLTRCALCGKKWCLDHQANPLVCPGCGARPSEGS